jgi:hypothetical protein
VRAKTTVILEAAFQIDNKEGHFQKKCYRHNQIQTLFNHLSETEKVLERSLRQGNLLNIASRGNRGVKDEKTIEQSMNSENRILNPVRSQTIPLISTFTSQFSRKQIPRNHLWAVNN